MNKIGIVGQGFVGTAVNEGMKNAYEIETYDKFLRDSIFLSSINGGRVILVRKA